MQIVLILLFMAFILVASHESRRLGREAGRNELADKHCKDVLNRHDFQKCKEEFLKD